MSALLFYSDPVPLDKKKHANLKFKAAESLAFASGANSVPIAGSEIFAASRYFPVLFYKNSAGVFLPLVLLSLKREGNDLGKDWGGFYIPAFVRRYPFALTDEGLVVIDSKAEHFKAEDGEKLFEEDGEATETLKKIVHFLEVVNATYKGTEAFCKALVEKDLLVPFNTKLNFKNTSIQIGEMYAIDEKKLNQLNDAEIADWFKKGWIAWSYAHLHSISALNELARRHARANQTAAANDVEPVEPDTSH